MAYGMTVRPNAIGIERHTTLNAYTDFSTQIGTIILRGVIIQYITYVFEMARLVEH